MSPLLFLSLIFCIFSFSQPVCLHIYHFYSSSARTAYLFHWFFLYYYDFFVFYFIYFSPEFFFFFPSAYFGFNLLFFFQLLNFEPGVIDLRIYSLNIETFWHQFPLRSVLVRLLILMCWVLIFIQFWVLSYFSLDYFLTSLLLRSELFAF